MYTEQNRFICRNWQNKQLHFHGVQMSKGLMRREKPHWHDHVYTVTLIIRTAKATALYRILCNPIPKCNPAVLYGNYLDAFPFWKSDPLISALAYHHPAFKPREEHHHHINHHKDLYIWLLAFQFVLNGDTWKYFVVLHITASWLIYRPTTAGHIFV